ncbi:hypothetical protein K5I29_04920 [Flavobacterium agricola]|uniref:Uncharacterized protein n=1 Tax=Flavobacterium agricola TaxID=2870839 RepID=A0ABY6M3Y0_9FLAO|nr:hypothetical protein [Flavobacterium agricola]UYW02245.1 hypothetical protein K5I29_04920 [Flavobacterium agricola]
MVPLNAKTLFYNLPIDATLVYYQTQFDNITGIKENKTSTTTFHLFSISDSDVIEKALADKISCKEVSTTNQKEEKKDNLPPISISKLPNIFETKPENTKIAEEKTDVIFDESSKNKFKFLNNYALDKKNVNIFQNKKHKLPFNTNISDAKTKTATMFTNHIKKRHEERDVVISNEIAEQAQQIRETFNQYESFFNSGSFDAIKHFKPVDFDRSILETEVNTISDSSFDAISKINNFFSQSKSTNKSLNSETISTIQNSKITVDERHLLCRLNLDEKEENKTFYLKFDTHHNKLKECAEENEDNIFAIRKVANDAFEFEMLENKMDHNFYYLKKDLFLELCEVLNTQHESHNKIKTIRKGELAKNQDKWVVTSKAKTMYQ